MFIVNLIIYYINNKSIYVSHLLETLAQSAGAEVVKKAALLAEGNKKQLATKIRVRTPKRSSLYSRSRNASLVTSSATTCVLHVFPFVST